MKSNKKMNFCKKKKLFFCTELYSAYENDAYFDYFGAPGPQKDDDDDDEKGIPRLGSQGSP